MKAVICALCALLGVASALAAERPVPPPYRVVKTVPLGLPDDWDFVQFDPSTKRVYVAHGTEITVVDARTGRVAGHIRGIRGAHGVAIVPVLGRGYADNGDTGEVTVFDLRSLKPIGTIPADRDADAMAYDAVTHRLVVGSGDAHAASIIDVAAGKRLKSVPLGGSAEGMALDGRGDIFINVDTANQIARLNLRTGTIDARWATPGCEAPHGLAIDRAARRLFASCKNGRMAVIDAVTGSRLALIPIGLGTDSAAFDPVRRRAFSANKDGTLSIIVERGGRLVSLGDMPTAPGAKNMAIDSRSGRIFLVTATAAVTHPPRKPGRPPGYDFAPGTVKLLILDPVR